MKPPSRHFRFFHLLSMAGLLFGLSGIPAAAQKQGKHPRPKRLDDAIELHRDAAGELRATPRRSSPASPGVPPPPESTARILAQVSLVELNCNVLRANGSQVRGLGQDAFRVFENGVEQHVAHFDASIEPASLVLLLDASPSVLPDLGEMKRAARALAAELGPADEVAVATLGPETHLLLPFSRDRAELERAIDSIQLDLVGQGSNIYQAIYLAAREIFPGRTGRKALLLLTDGQDSGLGLSWSPASALPRGGAERDRLSFEDVARTLGEEGIELDAVSTQPRPRAMTDAWLAQHGETTLLGDKAREMEIPHYTLYLAEMARRAGGRIYFLREIGTLGEVYKRIAVQLGAQYTLGYYPSAGTAKSGWRTVRVALAPEPQAAMQVSTIRHRLAYYVPASP